MDFIVDCLSGCGLQTKVIFMHLASAKCINITL